MKASRNNKGFTLVELMIVVAIVGVLSALGTYGVAKYLANSKTAEARNALGHIARDATTAFAREGMAASVLSLGNSAGFANVICGSSTNKVPASADSVKGGKYQSSPTDWQTGDQFTGWTCLRFAIEDPQYYQYGYSGSGTGAVGASFLATAEGNLDGDDKTSIFSIGGEIKSDGSDIVLVTAPDVYSDLADE